jgi:ADP-heptose:LPS heptosyltransferase
MRTLPLASLAPVFEMPSVTFVNLERGEDDTLSKAVAVYDAETLSAAAALSDVDEMAALLQSLDCVITADNSVAHLAGALGCRTLIMLSCSADWRWKSDGATSPWYPSVQLYRQPRPGDWSTVAAQVAQALEALRGQQ